MPTNRPPRFQPGISQDDLIAGYEKIGSRAPFTQSDIEKAYQPYGLKIDKKRKKASDSELHKIAAMAVVKWHKGQKAAAKKAASNPAPSTQSAPARTASSAARPSTPAPITTARQLFDDDYVARAMRTIGLAGISASSVPAEHRRSYADLVAYLNQVKAQRALAVRSSAGGGIKLIR